MMDSSSIEMKQLWNQLVYAINVFNKVKISQLLTQNPQLITHTDEQGNSLFHYAAAAHNSASISFLQCLIPCLTTAPNNSAERAADWFRVYLNTVIHRSTLVDDLKKLPQKIAEGDITFFQGFVGNKICPTLRFVGGATALHLTIQHKQSAMVALLLESMSDAQVEQVYKLKNCAGETPLTLAQTVAQQDIIRLLDKAQQQSAAAAAIRPAGTLTQPAWTIVLPQVQALTKLFANEVKESDFAELRSYLSTLCGLIFLNCQQALAELKSLRTKSPVKYCKFGFCKKKQLLKPLFGHNINKTIIDALYQKITAIANYLTEINQSHQIEQKIILTTKLPGVKSFDNSTFSGQTMFIEQRIYLNPTLETSLLQFIATLTHELTHLVTNSYDFVFDLVHLKNNKNHKFFLQPFHHLATDGVSSTLLSQEKLDLLLVQQMLEHTDSDNSYQWTCLNNADTLTMAIILLSAHHNGYVALNDTEQSVTIDQAFLSIESLQTLSQSESLWVKLIHFVRRNSKRLVKSLSGSSIAETEDSSPSTPNSDISTRASGSPNLGNTQNLNTAQLKQEMASLDYQQDAIAGPSTAGSASDSARNLAPHSVNTDLSK